MKEVIIYDDNHSAGMTTSRMASVVMEKSGKLRTEKRPKIRTYESETEGSFKIKVGSTYTIRYTGNSLQEAYGRVREVAGIAADTERLTLLDAKFTYDAVRHDGKEPAEFVTSYIAGTEIIDNETNKLVFAYQPVEQEVPHTVTVSQPVENFSIGASA